MKDNEIMSIPESSPESVNAAVSVGSDVTSTQTGASFLRKMRSQPPLWLTPMLAGMSREKIRVRQELGRLKGVLPLLMKQRNGGKWTEEERLALRAILRSATAVSPYFLIWVLPGSVVLLPFLAWHLDTRRKRREAKTP